MHTNPLVALRESLAKGFYLHRGRIREFPKRRQLQQLEMEERPNRVGGIGCLAELPGLRQLSNLIRGRVVLMTARSTRQRRTT